METTEKAKSTKQLSQRLPLDLATRLEAAAHEKGLTLTEYSKAVLEASLHTETKQKPPLKPSKSLIETSETEGDFIVLLKESNEKHDQVIELLGKLVETTQPAETETDLVYSEEDFNSALGQALADQEKEIKDNHLMIRLTESQKRVVNKLLAYRKEKGKKLSESMEEFFFFIMKEAINDSWNTKHPEFEDEFKEAFGEYFELVKF